MQPLPESVGLKMQTERCRRAMKEKLNLKNLNTGLGGKKVVALVEKFANEWQLKSAIKEV